MSWIMYGIGAAISFAAVMLIYKKVLLLGVHPLMLNLSIFLFTTIGFFVWVTKQKIPMEISTEAILFLVLASVFALAGNYFDVTAIKLAPNPGYVTALKAGQIILITLIAPLLYSDTNVSVGKLVGVFTVLAGILLISFSK